eukprot:SAG31_NODE_107_length_24865_cov_17.973593_10_plen_133_part_00
MHRVFQCKNNVQFMTKFMSKDSTLCNYLASLAPPIRLREVKDDCRLALFAALRQRTSQINSMINTIDHREKAKSEPRQSCKAEANRNISAQTTMLPCPRYRQSTAARLFKLGLTFGQDGLFIGDRLMEILHA